MWNELADAAGQRFVDDDCSLLLTLNVDWFQPFSTGRIHSVGAIYLTINNLPGSERYEPENVILVGVMPGLKEPSKHQMDHYQRPLVDELLDLIFRYQHRSNTDRRIRAALLMVGCDIPAARKVSGFTCIGSICPCYKYKRQFPNTPGNNLKRDFSGFSKENIAAWERRNGGENRVHAEAWRHASILDEHAAIEQQHGTRWTELHRLLYFDAVRCTVIGDHLEPHV